MAKFAYSFTQTVPAERVTSNNQTIVDLIERDHGVSVGADVLDGWTTAELNARSTFKALDTQAARTPGDTASGSVSTYIAFEGGFAYETEQQFTPAVPPSLEQIKFDGLIEAKDKSLAFLNGGFTFNSDNYDTSPDVRSLYAETGVEAIKVGGAFSTTFRDEDHAAHNFNAMEWSDFYTAFFTHISDANAALETAQLEIISAVTEQEVIDALDAIPDPIIPPIVPEI